MLPCSRRFPRCRRSGWFPASSMTWRLDVLRSSFRLRRLVQRNHWALSAAPKLQGPVPCCKALASPHWASTGLAQGILRPGRSVVGTNVKLNDGRQAIVAIKVHHLVPGRNEILDELFV